MVVALQGTVTQELESPWGGIEWLGETPLMGYKTTKESCQEVPDFGRQLRCDAEDQLQWKV